MKITFHGAAGGEVTGSCYLIETAESRILLDCGLFQGGHKMEALNHLPPGAAGVNAVVLTHGHLDHSGRLPLLARTGFTGPIFATPATIEMTGLILRDSAKIQAQDAERHNRKRQRAGEDPEEPLYLAQHVEQILERLQPVPYDEPVAVAPGIRACYAEAGHMLGSTSIKLFISEGGREKTVVFSGDLGPRGAPILKDYETFQQADAVILESTYGDRDHKPLGETIEQFLTIVRDVARSGGKILVPTFAVGRAQLLTLLLAEAFRAHRIPPFPIYLDSPMAIEASKIYQHHVELFDEDLVRFLREGSLREDLATLHLCPTAEDSKKLNDVSGPCLILAGAGMCNAGRIQHHLKQNLWKPDTHVIIAGFQAADSLGRRLVEGARTVQILGDKVAVKAQIHTLGGFSAHAGQTDLLNWFSAVAGSGPRVFLTHGENPQRTALAEKIRAQHGLTAHLPELGETLELP
jgi:metallo-beta-lactamase family protein